MKFSSRVFYYLSGVMIILGFVYTSATYVIQYKSEQRVSKKSGRGYQPQVHSSRNKIRTRKISRQDASRILDGDPSIFKGVSFGPVMNKGSITGYEIFKIGRSSFFYRLGLRPGDIVQKIGGFPVNNAERMLHLWFSMRIRNHVTVDLKRNGKIFRYHLMIVN